MARFSAGWKVGVLLMIANLPILPFRANWASPVVLRSTFATSQAIQSAPGSITRSSGRDYGQRQIKFALLPNDDFRRQWDAFREVNPPGTILGVPLWSEQGIVLTADASANATALHVSDASNIDWRGEAVLISAFPSGTPPQLTLEGVTITSVSGNTINIASPGLTNAFKAGDEVLPIMRGFQIDDYTDTLLSPETSDMELVFDESLGSMSAVAFPSAPTYPTYLGMPVLPLIAEWSQSPKISIGQGTHSVARGLNAEAFATFGTYVRQKIQHDVGMDGRADRALLWQFFHDRKGRFSRFWLPCLKDELKLSANVASGDTTLQLENFSQFATRYSGDQRRAIFLTDGFNYWIRQVINLAGGTNRVTIDNSLGAALNAGASQIGMLTLVQFAADDLELQLDAPVVATATLSFTELEREYAEVITAGTASGTRQGMTLVHA